MRKNTMASIASNFILNTDSYKASHYLQYPDGTEKVYSYIESRGGEYDKLVFFGLQAFIKEYLEGPVITGAMIDEAEEFFKAHGEPFNREGWDYILKTHNGLLPIRIDAVKEGTVVPVKNILVSVVNTDPKCFWLTSYVETALLRAIWYPTTVATVSWRIKQIIKDYLMQTADNTDGLAFKLHDFGARGVSSLESAALGGMAHLINFMGSDTVSGVRAAQMYYGVEGGMPAFSIPAAEHSTMTIRGRSGEIEQMSRMVAKFAKPGALFAVVSDSYDILAACKTWGTVFKERLINSGAMLVVRPDSGDPVKVSIDVLHELDKYFGSTTNSKGFRVLNNVRMIYGDGINEVTIRGILLNAKMAGFSADNIAFGMGGALLQHMNRDTCKFAMKASSATINGVEVEVFKDPVTDTGKASKKGRMGLYKSRLTNEIWTIRNDNITVDSEWVPMMDAVFIDGRLLRNQTFDEVRAISNQ
jgi:nicotinamide phosphoribosyltransferase